MNENATTSYYRNQMDSWPEVQLIQALRHGLPWHEHMAASALLRARKTGRLRRRHNLAWRARSWRQWRGVAHFSWLCLLPILAAGSSARLWRSAARQKYFRRP
jgi:hypothetical protein